MTTKQSSAWNHVAAQDEHRRCGAGARMNSARGTETQTSAVWPRPAGWLPVRMTRRWADRCCRLLADCEFPLRKFDRKSYFSIRTCKELTITQYDSQQANGCVEFEFGGWLPCAHTRAHLEEDVARVFHFERTAAWISTAPACPHGNRLPRPDITSADMATNI